MTRACQPSSAAIDRHSRTHGIISVINVTAAVGRERQFLAPRRQAPQVPSRAGKGALRVLAFDPQDREAVRLELEPAAGDVVHAEARVDRRAGQSELSSARLPDAQALERPAGDRDVGVGADPLHVDDIAQAIVIGDVVPPGHGFVARDAE